MRAGNIHPDCHPLSGLLCIPVQFKISDTLRQNQSNLCGSVQTSALGRPNRPFTWLSTGKPALQIMIQLSTYTQRTRDTSFEYSSVYVLAREVDGKEGVKEAICVKNKTPSEQGRWTEASLTRQFPKMFDHTLCLEFDRSLEYH